MLTATYCLAGLTYKSPTSTPDGRSAEGPMTLASRPFCPRLSPICLSCTADFLALNILTKPSSGTGSLWMKSSEWLSHFNASSAIRSGGSLRQGFSGEGLPVAMVFGSLNAIAKSSGKNSSTSHWPDPWNTRRSGHRSCRAVCHHPSRPCEAVPHQDILVHKGLRQLQG